MSYFNNKIVAIPGGNDGIGKAIVKLLFAKGARVATGSPRYDKLYNLQLKYPTDPLHTIKCDISKVQDSKHFIESTLKTFGRINALINIAGISLRALFKDCNLGRPKRITDVNFWGGIYCAKFVISPLFDNKRTIVGISAMAATHGFPGRNGYTDTKFTLQEWMEAFRLEMMDQNVRIMQICLGYTKTGIRRSALENDGHPVVESLMDEETFRTPEEMAAIVLSAIERIKRNVFATLQGIRIAFSSRFFPEFQTASFTNIFS